MTQSSSVKYWEVSYGALQRREAYRVPVTILENSQASSLLLVFFFFFLVRSSNTYLLF